MHVQDGGKANLQHDTLNKLVAEQSVGSNRGRRDF